MTLLIQTLESYELLEKAHSELFKYHFHCLVQGSLFPLLEVECVHSLIVSFLK